MSEVGVSNRVVVRNSFGRFIKQCDQAAQDTAEELVKRGAAYSREMAPVGPKHDRRTIPIQASIETRMTSSTSGVWFSMARHALHQEFGTKAHLITGNPYMHFFWDNAGRWWVPGLFGEPDIINHPGHGAQPFLRPAYKRVMAEAMSVAKANYP